MITYNITSRVQMYLKTSKTKQFNKIWVYYFSDEKLGAFGSDVFLF